MWRVSVEVLKKRYIEMNQMQGQIKEFGGPGSKEIWGPYLKNLLLILKIN